MSSASKTTVKPNRLEELLNNKTTEKPNRLEALLNNEKSTNRRLNNDIAKIKDLLREIIDLVDPTIIQENLPKNMLTTLREEGLISEDDEEEESEEED